MAVETKKVTGRRDISYSSYDELLADAQSVAASDNVKMVGNWSLAQIFQHLAAALRHCATVTCGIDSYTRQEDSRQPN
jgi:hypothetical protein